ncbi:MAG: septum formation protein Maf, partial [Deinococcus sp.]|nr:septum formation protein Maf [Deinococcus sp.]
MYQEPVILASASPRRRELMAWLGVPFRVEPSQIQEGPLQPPFEQAVRQLALHKTREVHSRVGGLVVGADTVVVVDQAVLGKPEDEEQAREYLQRLSGREHLVLTGLAVLSDYREHTETVTTQVRFLRLSEEEIARYVASGEPMDKAGAYGIQD